MGTLPTADQTSRNEFWTEYQPGFRVSDAPVGSREFFDEVEAERYALEPAIPELVQFERWKDRDVLEAGCGIATDGARFTRAGARYTGVDFSQTALSLAQHRFEQEGLAGRFVESSIVRLPFDDASFDLVYSNGVIHHLPETEAVVQEFRRVLRPGGTAIVMVYHRGSLNHHVNIMLLRRLLVGALLVPGAAGAIARLTGEDPAVLEGHRELLREHGLRYVQDRQLFLNNNTDGPGNPLSKVYGRDDVPRLFEGFESTRTRVRFLNLRIYPGGERLAGLPGADALDRRIGGHLWIEARNPA